MADIVDRKTRSRMMAAIGSTNTAPEISVRRYLHACGLRFRLHDRRLPGSPDIVLKRHHVAIFVHGCFWHRHPGCRFAHTPATNAGFWNGKFEGNVKRDAAKTARLEGMGWTVLVAWECETRSTDNLDLLYWAVRAGSAAGA